MSTILITYANDAQAPLRVAAEAKDVQRLLEGMPNKAYQVKLLPEVSTADLTKDLMHIEHELEVLHYCGHAHAGALAFTAGDAGAEQLAARLKHCKNLKLVFLNGCKTRAQVRFFHEAGVPYILATSTKVADAEAHWFALQFYQYLVLGYEVVEVFERAKADATLSNRNFDLLLSRDVAGLSDPDLEDEEKQTFDWGLYAQEGSEGYWLPLRAEEKPSAGDIPHATDGSKTVIQHAENIYNIERIDKADFGQLLNKSPRYLINWLFNPEDFIGREKKFEATFEALCCDLAKEKYGDFDVRKYGRRGQKQWGVDIKATDRKRNNQRIVIQCKYKCPSFKASVPFLENEIVEEFAAATEKHEFDVFIYATNLSKNSQLEDLASAMSEQHQKDIRIWWADSIDEEIGRYPRLERLYVEGESSGRVMLIDGDFIEDLWHAESEGDANADLFHFYIGSQAGNCQWLGVLHSWDAPRACRGDVEANIEKLFAKKFLDARIAALVRGEGGSGKSTLLRRIALDSADARNRFNWWVEDVDDFLESDAHTVAANPHQPHLIFIDDWYRNKPADAGRAFFQWLQDQPNALVLLGDRSQQSGYAEHLYAGAAFLLESAENKAVLEHIAGVSEDHQVVMAEIMQEEQRYGNSPLSMVLYVASHLLKEQNPVQGFDLNDGVKTKFQKIIAKKLLDLENDERYRGLGKALCLLAKMYASPNMNYVVFPEDFFLKTAAFFGKNDTLPRRLRAAYPERVNSLVHKRAVYSERLDRQLAFIHFNHDVLAEQGIVGAASVSPILESLLAFDLFDLEELMKRLAGNAEPNGMLWVWRWCFLENRHWEKDIAFEILLSILKQGLPFVAGGVFFHVLQAISSSEDKKKICRFVLAQSEFFRLPPEIISTSLKLLEREEAGKQAARNILSQPDFIRLPPDIICSSLKLLEREEAGKQAARDILSQHGFIRLPPEIISTSLKLLEREEAGKQAARDILVQPDFIRLPNEIISTSLKLLEREAAGKQAARDILARPNFFRLPAPIISSSLKLLEKEEAGKQAARVILSQPNFIRLSHQIISSSLKLLEREQAGKQAARDILSQPDFIRLSHQIISTSLKLLEREDAGKQTAKEILAQPDFIRLPFQIISTSLKLLEREEAGKQAAREILSQPDFIRLPKEIISTSLKLLEREEAGKQAAREILSQPDFIRLPFEIISTSLKLIEKEEAGKQAAKDILAQPDFIRLPKEIVSTSLKLLEREDTGKQAAREILPQPDFIRLPFEIVSISLKLLEREDAGKQAARMILGKISEVDTFLIFAALKTLLPTAHATDLERIKNVVWEINTTLRQQSKAYDRLHYDLLYLPLFELPEHRERVLKIIRFFKPELNRLQKYRHFQILNCYREYPGIPHFQEEIKNLCETILHHCVADLAHQYREHPRELIFGHIQLALQHPNLLPQAKKSMANLKAYASRNANFGQSAFFEWLMSWEANGYQAVSEEV